LERLERLTEDEFEHIEDTIARTAKGRAFLRRFARRAQGGASEEIRALLDRMHEVLSTHQEVGTTAQHVAVLRRELVEMASSIEKARREVAALRPPDDGTNKILTATNELDAIVTSTERASFDILNSAERLMDLSGRLRKSGVDEQLCSDIEKEVMDIFTACSFQDLTGQRTSKVVGALRYIEQRINAMMQIWTLEGAQLAGLPEEDRDERPDSHLLSGPALPGQGVSQSDVDAMFGAPSFSIVDPEPDPGPEPEPEPEPAPPPKAAPAPARKPKSAKPAEPPPAEPEPPAAIKQPLDQSAIDALFG
jgi:chemotaxis regulatin CheY-phosphate phosphatase CheZ